MSLCSVAYLNSVTIIIPYLPRIVLYGIQFKRLFKVSWHQKILYLFRTQRWAPCVCR